MQRPELSSLGDTYGARSSNVQHSGRLSLITDLEPKPPIPSAKTSSIQDALAGALPSSL
ncbi:hypothetical protein GCM10011517_31410 [Actibacterium pelagium]|uniref:Uncharacterized protein n=1 Tax=Actibacterium pelagium TaxID=2029103 RepID=A0A917EP07_9RHOB|nr:hypothetical protein GCM10011517_31410 [Actibacterium pelagium]